MRYHNVIGLDFGTAKSSVSVWDNEQGTAVMIPTRTGQYTVPSVVGISTEGRLVVGEPPTAYTDPAHVVAGVKARLGWCHPAWTYAESAHLSHVHLKEHNFSLYEIAALILFELKCMAETFVGTPIHDAVVCVPAWFRARHRTAMVDACSIAGLKVHRLVNEMTAAAVHLGMNVAGDGRQHIYGMYGLGEGGFEFSVAAINTGHVKVLGATGKSNLGGSTATAKVCAWVLDQVRQSYGVDLRGDAAAYNYLLYQAEEAKSALSTSTETRVYLPPSRHWPVHVEGTKMAEKPFKTLFPAETATMSTESDGRIIQAILWADDKSQVNNIIDPPAEYLNFERTTFESLIDDVLRSSLACMDEAIDWACSNRDIERDQIEHIVLVGGSTRIPCVRALIAEHMGLDLRSVRRPIDMDQVIARGAAIIARGLNPSGNRRIDERGHAAVRESGPATPVQRVHAVEDLSSCSVGFSAGFDEFLPVIPKGSTLPIHIAYGEFTNTGEGSHQIVVDIFQGENRTASENEYAGKIRIMGLEPRPTGFHRFEVTLGLDSSELLKVRVKDLRDESEPTVELEVGQIAEGASRKLSDHLRDLLKTNRRITKPAKIFISYRHESSGRAGRLCDHLSQVFPDRVFIDIAGIEPGTDFEKRINDAIGSCYALVAVIENRWFPPSERWTRRLKNTTDFVRLEVATALKMQKYVLPVLMAGASMPSPQELPNDIRKIASTQAMSIMDDYWDEGIARLVDLLKRADTVKSVAGGQIG